MTVESVFAPAHHGAAGAASRFDWVDVVVAVLVLAALAGVGTAVWRRIRRRHG